jgi:hypothetical protein
VLPPRFGIACTVALTDKEPARAFLSVCAWLVQHLPQIGVIGYPVTGLPFEP